MSLESQLTLLAENKTSIKTAIEAKNPSVAPTNELAQWPTSIASIQGQKIEQSKTVSPTTFGLTVTPDTGKALSSVVVNPVTSSIDANIVAGNIKKDIAILGVTGTYEGSGGGGLQGHTLSVITNDDAYYHASGIRVYKADGSYEDFLNASTNTYVVQDAVYFETFDTVGKSWATGRLIINYPDINNRHIRGVGYNSMDGARFYVLMDGMSVQAFYDDGCFLKGTKITLSDGSEKNAEDIMYDDELLVWDFDNGCLAKSKPIWIQRKQTLDYYFLNRYKSGKIFKTTGQMGSGFGHRVFNMDKKKFIYDVESVGSRVYTLDGIDLHVVCERIDEPCEYYNIITERHINLFANRLLTSCSLNNIYEFDVDKMKFIKDNRRLRTISEYNSIPKHWFDGLRLSENVKEICDLEKYVNRLILTDKAGEKQW